VKLYCCVLVDAVTVKEIGIIASSEKVLCEKLENEFNFGNDENGC